MNISEQVARLEEERDLFKAERDALQARIDVETWTRADGSTNPRVGERRKASDGASWRINQTAETVGKIRWGTSKDRRKA
jgi:hypothetical protein